MKKINSVVNVASFEQKLLRAFCLIFLIVVLLLLCLKPPYWSLMDEPAIVREMPNIVRQKALGEYLVEYSKSDIASWGMFRPVYYAYIYYAYGYLSSSVSIFYAINFVVVLSILWGWSVLFEKYLMRSLASHGLTEQQGWRYLFFTLCCLFTPHYNLFYYPTTQERFTLLFGLLVYWGLLEIGQEGKKFWLKSSAVIGGLILALLGKASSLFMVPVALIYLLMQPQPKRRQWYLIVSVIAIGLLFGWLFLSIRTAYSSQYQLASFFERFLSHGIRFQIPFVTGAIGVIVLTLGWFVADPERSLQRLSNMLIWPLSLLGYVTIMYPWKHGLSGYYLLPSGVFWIGTIMLGYGLCLKWINRFFPRLRPWVLIGGLLVLSCFSIKKLYAEALQHYGTRLVLDKLSDELKDANDNLIIRMPPPCLEAANHLSGMLGRPGSIRVLAPNDTFLDSSVHARRLLIIDKECNARPSSFRATRVLLDAPPWFVYEGIID